MTAVWGDEVVRNLREATEILHESNEGAMNEPTPGPWVATKAGPIMRGYMQGDAVASVEHNTLVAGCFSDVRGGPEVAEANARLIAASPELLMALKDLLADGTRRAGITMASEAELRARAAIAKAESK